MAKPSLPETRVVTGVVRFSYVHVFEPWAGSPTAEPRYSVALLIPKSDTATVAKIRRAVDAAKQTGRAKWGGKIPATLKLPLRDGDAERPDQPEYAGHWFLNATSKSRPNVVDVDLDPIIDTTEFYSGCFGRASINFYPFAVSGNAGVAVGLNNLQKVRDGEPLGGTRSRPEDDFGSMDDLDDPDFLS